MDNMNKVPNWHVAVAALATEVVGKPFEWGVTDCVTIARRAIVEMYGKDLVATVIPKISYSTKGGATRAYNKVGSFHGVFVELGAREVELFNAREGDIAVFTPESGYENVMTMMGGSWILADPDINKIIAVRPSTFRDDPNMKVYRLG